MASYRKSGVSSDCDSSVSVEDRAQRKGRIVLSTITLLWLGACSIISSSYIPSAPSTPKPRDPAGLLVFYSTDQVPFAYTEIGRVFLKNINYWAKRDPGGQVDKIRHEAAANGADAVIIVSESRWESSGGFFVAQGYAGGSESTSHVYQLSGIAIIRKQ